MSFVIGGALAFTALQGISACSQSGITLDQVVRVLGGHQALGKVEPLGEVGTRELTRFYTAFDRYTNSPDDLRQRGHFQDSFRLIRSNYVVKVDDVALIDAALKAVEAMDPVPGGVEPSLLVETALDGIMTVLDPHSSYLNADEFRESTVYIKGEFGGLGIEVTMQDGVIKVVSPIEDTPAFRAGIKPGDLITHLNGTAIKASKTDGDKGLSLSDSVKIMRGRPGSPITITIKRQDLTPFDVTIVRAVIHVRSVRWRLDGDIGYVKVVSFTQQVEYKLADAMTDIFAQGRSKNVEIKGFVLDLRNNPGGLLTQSLLVSDAFLEGGQIVAVRERNPERDRVFMAEPGDLSNGLPVVVLINEGSASASEIVAGALKDHHRAVIMGRRSFGKGSVQTIQPLPIEGALRLTTARYYAPAGYTIQARGVVPDIRLTIPAAKDVKNEHEIRRESDLPGALNAEEYGSVQNRAIISSSSCPVAGPEQKDHELGCALAYLHADSLSNFLSTIPTPNPQ